MVVIEKVKERQQMYDLKTKIGIHLRGSDRAKKLDKSHRMAGISIRMVSAGLLNGVKFVGLSDDPDYVSMWQAKHSEFPMLTELGSLGGKEGVHNKSKDSLTITKDSLNVDMLSDFFTLASCRSVISTSKDSRFAQEAQRLSKFLHIII